MENNGFVKDEKETTTIEPPPNRKMSRSTSVAFDSDVVQLSIPKR